MRFNIFAKASITLLVAFSGAFGVGCLEAYAQSASDIVISVTPGTPSAREGVSIALSSFSINLTTANISWLLNNKLQNEGVGKTTFQFTAGELGSISRIRIIVSATEGRFEKTFEIRPAEIDLIIEPLTYTPPFYKGRALSTSQSKLKIVAIPHFIQNGKRIASGTVVYTWRRDREILGSLSGVGKESIIIQAPRLGENATISVTASSQNGTFEAANEISITPRNPLILFYEKHPTEGVKYERALVSTTELLQDETTIRGEPYFFATEDLAGRYASFNWSLNGNPIEPGGLIHDITLRRNEQKGTASLALRIQNAVKILQEAGARLEIKF